MRVCTSYRDGVKRLQLARPGLSALQMMYLGGEDECAAPCAEGDSSVWHHLSQGGGDNLKAAFSREHCTLQLRPPGRWGCAVRGFSGLKGTGHQEGRTDGLCSARCSARLAPWGLAALWGDAAKLRLCPVLLPRWPRSLIGIPSLPRERPLAGYPTTGLLGRCAPGHRGFLRLHQGLKGNREAWFFSAISVLNLKCRRYCSPEPLLRTPSSSPV